MVMRIDLFGTPAADDAGVVAALLGAEACVQASHGPLDAAIVWAVEAEEAYAFADLDDAGFARLCLDPLIAIEAATAAALDRLVPGGALLFVGSDAHLGEPEAAAQSAASGAMMTLARSIGVRATVRANMILLPYGADRRGDGLSNDVARVGAALIAAPSLNGQAIYLDEGAHLIARYAGRR